MRLLDLAVMKNKIPRTESSGMRRTSHTQFGARSQIHRQENVLEWNHKTHRDECNIQKSSHNNFSNHLLALLMLTNDPRLQKEEKKMGTFEISFDHFWRRSREEGVRRTRR